MVVTPSMPVAAVSRTTVTFTANALTGLSPSTAFSYTFDKGDGTTTACMFLGSTDAAGTLPAVSTTAGVASPYPVTGAVSSYTALPGSTASLSATYSTAGTFTAVLTVYLASQCVDSVAPASAVAVARGSATVKVGFFDAPMLVLTNCMMVTHMRDMPS